MEVREREKKTNSTVNEMGAACSGWSSDSTTNSGSGRIKETGEKRAVLNYDLAAMIETVMLIRHECRTCFGPSFADKWGYWVDYYLSKEIHSYWDWAVYPKGDHVLRGHTVPVLSCAITTDGKYLFTGSMKRSIIKWDLRMNAMIEEFIAHRYAVLSLACTNGILISGGNCIKIWDSKTCSLIRILEGHTESVWSLTLSKEGTTLMSGSLDNTCRVWSVKSGECMMVLEGHNDTVSTVHFTDEMMMITGSFDKSIRIWDSDSGNHLRTITDGIRSNISHISLNCDSSMMVCVHLTQVCYFKWPSMEVITLINEHYSNALCSCFHPFNPNILALSQRKDYCIKLIRIDLNFQCIGILKGGSNHFFSIAFTPDGSRLIATSQASAAVRVWDVSEIES